MLEGSAAVHPFAGPAVDAVFAVSFVEIVVIVEVVAAEQGAEIFAAPGGEVSVEQPAFEEIAADAAAATAAEAACAIAAE